MTLKPEYCAKKLHALASPERLRILRRLIKSPTHVNDLAEAIGIPPVNASHHLQVLLVAGLVESSREGRHVLYSLPSTVLTSHTRAGAELPVLNLGCCQFEMPVDPPPKRETAAGRGRKMVARKPKSTR